jgi:hypothetical protein
VTVARVVKVPPEVLHQVGEVPELAKVLAIKGAKARRRRGPRRWRGRLSLGGKGFLRHCRRHGLARPDPKPRLEALLRSPLRRMRPMIRSARNLVSITAVAAACAFQVIHRDGVSSRRRCSWQREAALGLLR